MTSCITNVRIINADEDFVGHVVWDDGKILAICRDAINHVPTDVIIDGTGKILLPGLIDAHVHFREPGLVHKEDLASGSAAAVSGGVTSFFDMPNTIPPTFTVALLDQKRALAREKSVANFAFFMGASEHNAEEIRKATNIPGVKLYLNTTTGDLKMDTEEVWRQIFRIGKRVVLHAEGETFVRAVQIWEEEKYPCPLHLAHASQKKEIELVRTFKAQNIPQIISCEVTPHHLLLSQGDASVKPNIQSRADKEALWEGVMDGTIDILATDHAPHTQEEKAKGAYGIPGTETLLPIMVTEFQKRNIPLTRFVNMTSENVVRIFGVQDKKGRIKEGYDADMVLIDVQGRGIIQPENFFSKSKWSPFAGWESQVKVEQTFVGGECVFEKGVLKNSDFRGKEVRFL